MKKISNQDFINELINITKENIEQLEVISRLDKKLIDKSGKNNSWSVSQCIEHLNRYFDFYIPELKRKIHGGIATKKNLYFKSGWLGNYFADSVKYKSGTSAKMKTMKNMDPNKFGEIRLGNLETAKKYFIELLDLLEQSKGLDLQKIKTKISLTSFISLKLGDTLQFVVYHNDRHMNQALNKVRELETELAYN